MKKIRLGIVLVAAMFLFNIRALAASATLSVSSNNVSVGDKFTVYVNVKSSAAWNIHVSASGPVSGCVINQADTTADAMDTQKTFSAECNATGEGVVSISLSGDVTSANDGIAVNILDKKSVTVNKKVNNDSSNSNNSTNKVESKSTNNKIKDLLVEGYELKKIDENNYELSVNKDVTNINIKGTTEDSKAKISGVGKKDLKDGENKFEIVVTSESGLKNVINIRVLRKTEYNLDDLNDLLGNDNLNNIDIVVDFDSVISKDVLTKIKDSKKLVNFNVVDGNKNNVYSWIIDGSKIDASNDLKIFIGDQTDYKDNILKLSNYADGIFVNFIQEDINIKGVRVKLFVLDKYNNDNKLNVYSYDANENKLNLEGNILVEDGYIYLENIDDNIYFITMSNINNLVDEEENNSNIFLIILSIIELLIIISLIIIFVCKRRKIIKNSSSNIDSNQNLDLNNNNIYSDSNNLFFDNNNVSNNNINNNGNIF